ncbi:MAG: 3-phosphoshikimate 1-carboxyvinyltransferase [Candidatus Omnitrophica bacterium]|nr:3-phosphoshikimate 1-carboxyvinyltransferase [Candidatus Omnitrophota bacterium]
MSTFEIKPGTALEGSITPPGDKSISHRLVFLAALAEGRSRIRGFLSSDDCMRTVNVMRELGVCISEKRKDELEILGVGLHSLKSPAKVLYTGNSGTTTRMLMGISAGQKFRTVIDGDESIRKRPMKRISEPLSRMGAVIRGREDGNFTPISVEGGGLKPIFCYNKLSSAQVKSAVLIAGLYANGVTEIEEPFPSRDHTERLLERMGAEIVRKGNAVAILPPRKLNPIEATVPGDISSAAFWLAAGAVQSGKSIAVEGVGLNPTRTGFIKVLSKMGADIQMKICSDDSEPVGIVTVTGNNLVGISIQKDDIPSLIDEIPLIMVLGSLANGRTIIRGASELRVKETDRIQAMVKNLRTLGVAVKEYPDGVEIEGRSGLDGGEVESFTDHRMAMSMAIAGLRAKSPVKIKNSECVDISYPEFFTDFRKLAKI